MLASQSLSSSSLFFGMISAVFIFLLVLLAFLYLDFLVLIRELILSFSAPRSSISSSLLRPDFFLLGSGQSTKLAKISLGVRSYRSDLYFSIKLMRVNYLSYCEMISLNTELTPIWDSAPRSFIEASKLDSGESKPFCVGDPGCGREPTVIFGEPLRSPSESL